MDPHPKGRITVCSQGRFFEDVPMVCVMGSRRRFSSQKSTISNPQSPIRNPQSAMNAHIPVLALEAIEGLRIRPGGAYVDATVGGGGHAVLLANALESGRLIALDRDPSAVAVARRRLAPFSDVSLFHRSYAELASVIAEIGIEKVNGVLIDAGFSTLQLDDPQRGFSFQMEGPLDMRLDQTTGPTAAEYLSRATEAELAGILRQHGDIGPARRIARAIIARCRRHAMKTTQDLAGAVQEALDFVQGPPEELRTVFQAIRMAVNDELGHLETGLRQAIDILAPEGRLVVISFHSGEDRVIKNVFRGASRPFAQLRPDGRVASRVPARVRIVTPRPLTPTEAEIRVNPRSHSAKLRVAERL
jgi:16S rRNA (cytosine1402-N4)-methyltransferase